MNCQKVWIASLLVLSASCASESADTSTTVVPVGGAGAGAAPGPGGAVDPGTGTNTGAGIPESGVPGMSTGGAGNNGGATDAAGGAGPLPAGCVQGAPLTVVGMLYSPGGTVLPNPCLPFHPTTNNPYAVRCIDAWSWYKTKYPGDQFCILPPPPDMGVQFGVHPQGAKWFEIVSKGDMSGYDNPPDDFIMQDGEEEERNYLTSANTTVRNNYYRHYERMRGGSHHMINNINPPGGQKEKWGPGTPVGALLEFVPGAQRPDENCPKGPDKPAEDKGVYGTFPAAPDVNFNMHHFNATGGPILKETWLNMWWEKTDATVPIIFVNDLAIEVGQTLGMSIPPGDTQNFHYVTTIAQPTRLLTLFGHRHAWTTNFSAWLEVAGKEPEILYQSFYWLDEPTYRYDSLTQNPAPAPDKVTDGGMSGFKTLNPGEKLHYNCHIEYTEERAAQEKAISPAKQGTIRFSNQAFAGEMCLLFGTVTGQPLPPFAPGGAALPSFATSD